MTEILAETKLTTLCSRISNSQTTERMDSNDSGISDQECYFSTESESQSSSSTDSEITPMTMASTNSPNSCSTLMETKSLTRILCTFVILNMCNKKPNDPKLQLNRKHNHIETMNKMTEKILQENQKTFQNMITSLDISSINSARVALKRVFDGFFSDKNYNWARIVTLMAFSVEVARFGQGLNNEESEIFPEKISESIVEYLNKNLTNWIVSQGGWDGMDIFFSKKEKSDGTFWKNLLLTVFGIGALATTVVACR